MGIDFLRNGRAMRPDSDRNAVLGYQEGECRSPTAAADNADFFKHGSGNGALFFFETLFRPGEQTRDV